MIRKLQKEDKRKVLFMRLIQACDDFPEYSAGEILYSVLRKAGRFYNQNLSFLRLISNSDLAREAELSLNFEEDDNSPIVEEVYTIRKRRRRRINEI
jgi:hypothetical protein